MTSVMVALLLLFAWPQQAPNYSVSAQKAATAYFYMTSELLGGTAVSIDGKAVCRLQSRQYCPVQVAPGKHTIATNREWLENSFELESGKTYYSRLQVRAFRGASYFANIVRVTPEAAEVELRDCTRAETERL